MVIHINILFFNFISKYFIDNLTGGAYAIPDSMDIETLAQPPDKATYAEQANKRTHCRRLTK